MRTVLLAVSHTLTLALGFALGVYFLPILVAPPAPSAADVVAQAKSATYTGTFRRDLKDSDALHWGEGTVSVSRRASRSPAGSRRARTTSSTCRPSSSRPRPTSCASSRAWSASAT